MKITWKKLVVVVIGSGILKIFYNAFTANGVTEVVNMYINTAALENVYYLSQVMASIFVMLGTIIAIWQYILSSHDSAKNREREYQLHEKEIFEMEKDRVQKAIDLAGYYKDNILQNTMLIKHVYKKIGICEILDKINFQNISHFDIYEMEKNISVNDRSKIVNAPSDKKMAEALVHMSEIIKNWDECKEVSVVEENGKLIKKVTVAQSAMLYKFQTQLNEILNNLEFFAMHFTHGTADDSVIYQSLHQSYINTVRLLYYDISANNIPGESKLYTNVIELYNKWTQVAREQKDNETAAARENISKGNCLKSLDK